MRKNMRIIILIILSQLIFFSLWAGNNFVLESNSFSDQLDPVKKYPMAYSVIFSPGLFTTLGFGIAEHSVAETVERSVIVRAGIGPFIYGGGIYLQHRFYQDPTRTGMFYTFDLGADVVGLFGPDPGGGVGFTSLIVPNIAGGIGYSKEIGENKYFRISLDAGLKTVISNLNLSITF